MPGQPITTEVVRQHLDFGDDALAWLNELASVGAPPRPIQLPTPDDTPALLVRLHVPGGLIAEVIAAKPTPDRDPVLWWVLERCCHLLIKDMGGTEPLRRWPLLPPSLGAAGRDRYVCVVLAPPGAVRQDPRVLGVPHGVPRARRAEFGTKRA